VTRRNLTKLARPAGLPPLTALCPGMTVGDVFSRRDLKWRREGADDVVFCGRRRLLPLVPDATYPGMWRVAYPDGELGDRKNLTWARHEGARVALSLLNKRIVPGTSQRSPLTAARSRSVPLTGANSRVGVRGRQGSEWLDSRAKAVV
jgi:hypothetical protein